jgi:hypothetical protein
VRAVPLFYSHTSYSRDVRILTEHILRK